MFTIKTLATISAVAHTALALSVPSLEVHACPKMATLTYNKSVPDKTAFPLTQVDLCYDSKNIHLAFTAYGEKYFYYNESYTTNDEIYNYEVQEAFIYHGENDPATYMEFEVAPNNVTFNAFIFNPSKVRADGAPFDTLYIQTPQVDGLTSTTKLDRQHYTWVSNVIIPLTFFNVDNPKNTNWRMNFFRTIVNPKTFPNQTLGAWSPPNKPSFHITPYFGKVNFV